MPGIKVAHIITKLELGGAQNNTIYTVTHLDKNKFEPSLICGSGGILDEKVKVLFPSVIFSHYLKRAINPKDDLLALIELVKILKKLRPDIVHTHSSKAGILGRLAAKIARVKFIVHTYHGFGFNPEQNFFLRNFFVLLEKLVGKITDRIIFVSRANWQTAEKYLIGDKETYRLIRSGIELEKFSSARKKLPIPEIKKQLGVAENEPVILTIGPFKPQKNLRDFVEVAYQVRKDFSPITFLVVGDGAIRPEIEKEIARRNATGYIRLLGWRPDIERILAISDIFVLTSLWEGLPRSLLEAMASGLAPVVYSVDGCRDVIRSGENGFLIEVKNTSEMTKKILELLRDKNLYQRIAAMAQKSVTEEFSIDLMVRQQEKLYRELLENKTV